ncbi:MAG: MBL fold metallo-hydrolase [Alphaproteobacteria bacterium]|jgi:glyoxylase-like metal-dependent hydrolase (beta-lactamase superfamily II)|nr:MBL fold metallo-hydrolase [Alphaproteobacteria bacterium]
MKAVIVPVTPFQQNCTVLWCEETMKGAVIDPGGDIERIMGAADEKEVELEKVFLTHGHIDHAGGTAELAKRRGLVIEGPHKDDLFLIEKLARQGERFGFTHARPFEPDRWLDGGDSVAVGNVTLQVRHCPGHTPGHIVFFHADSNIAFVGDVLFRGSVGRTDLERGDHATLINAIREQLWPLGDEVTFVPGHGDLSTFGNERQSNPYCSDFVEV